MTAPALYLLLHSGSCTSSHRSSSPFPSTPSCSQGTRCCERDGKYYVPDSFISLFFLHKLGKASQNGELPKDWLEEEWCLQSAENLGSALINGARKVSEIWEKNEIKILKYVSTKCFLVQFMIKNNNFILITLSSFSSSPPSPFFHVLHFQGRPSGRTVRAVWMELLSLCLVEGLRIDLDFVEINVFSRGLFSLF